MGRTTLSSKGQIILPKAIRDAHGWGPGTQFLVEEQDGAVLLRPVSPLPPARVEEVEGCLRYAGRPKTLAEMDRGIAEEARRRHARRRY